MPVRTANAVWTGTLREGEGTMSFGSYSGRYTRASRFEDAEGTNPEELLGAAHAGCYTMFLSAVLTKAGFTPTRLSTTARVHLNEGKINLIELETEAEVPNLDAERLQAAVDESKANCPISKTLNTEIRATARLAG